MQDSEGVLSFDFEGGLDAGPTNPTASVPVVHPDNSASNATAVAAPTTTNNNYVVYAAGGVDSSAAAATGNYGPRRSFRQTVCRHWLRSLCMKGDACGFLHQYDKSRMPVCRFFRLYGECREQDCVYKHSNEDIKECNMYKLGFCPNGSDCRYRHAKLPGPPPPVEEVLQKIQQLNSYGYGASNRFFQQRNNNGQQYQVPQGPSSTNQGQVGKPSQTESFNVQLQLQQQVEQSQQLSNLTQLENQINGQPNPPSKIALPLPQGLSRYFIVKSCNRENLELSVQQAVWATQRSNEAKLNEAFDSAEHVILIFSVNRTRNFQGCAKMISKIGGSVGGGNWKYAHGTAHYGRNFSVKWLKLCELSFNKTRHLRNPYNENLPVKISRDCQELEPSIGEQLASLLYLEPDSELMAISIAAESKREEEKAKGLNIDNEADNPDIVPFEDNEEEEEEESDDEEDEIYGPPVVGPAAQGRGRGGRGLMWPPQMPLGRGGRPIPNMRGFPPPLMGSDGFAYGHITPDGFPMPDPFGMGIRPFVPYGPRFPGDFTSPMFHGRPPQAGAMFPGMMMGPGRGPFMGGMGPPQVLGGGRPLGMPPMFQQPHPQSAGRPVRRESGGSGQGGGAEDEGHYQQGARASQDDDFVVGNRNEESDSEDEAPRRSRHGEGKKKKRGSEEGDGNQ